MNAIYHVSLTFRVIFWAFLSNFCSPEKQVQKSKTEMSRKAGQEKLKRHDKILYLCVENMLNSSFYSVAFNFFGPCLPYVLQCLYVHRQSQTVIEWPQMAIGGLQRAVQGHRGQKRAAMGSRRPYVEGHRMLQRTIDCEYCPFALESPKSPKSNNFKLTIHLCKVL